MQAGPHNGISKTNIVLRAPKDLAFSIDVKRERMRHGRYKKIGAIETILFEGSDRNFTGTRQDMFVAGRRLYWPNGGPWIARSIPEEDLIFTAPLTLPLPMIPDAADRRERNPYEVDEHGESHLRDSMGNRAIMNTRDRKGNMVQSSLVRDGEFTAARDLGPRQIHQRLEDVASARYRNFLIFQPVAQIILMVSIKGRMEFASIGSVKYPLSTLSGLDGRKMALLIDPLTGEAFFSGGRYCVDVKDMPAAMAVPSGMQPMALPQGAVR